MTDDVLRAVRERDKAEAEARGEREIEIWPDMAPAVLTFMSMTTQWNFGMFGHRLGLRYDAVQPVASMLGLVIDAQAFLDLRVMELEAMAELGRRKNG